MNTIDNYKIKKLKEVDYFLRGLGLKSIKETSNNNQNITTYETTELLKELELELTEVASSMLEINKNIELRSLFETTIRNIDSMRYELEDTNLFFLGPTTEEEIDKEITKFIEKVMQRINELKNKFLLSFSKKEKIRINDSFESDSLEFLKVKIGDEQIEWKKEKKTYQVESRATVRELQETDSLARVLSYIYLLPCIIKKSIVLKTNMNNTLHELSKIFKPTSQTNKKILQTLGKIQNAKNEKEAMEVFCNLRDLLNKILEEIEQNYNKIYIDEMNYGGYENLKNIMNIINTKIPELQIKTNKHIK